MARPAWRERLTGVDAALFLLVVVLTVPLVQDLGAQQASRLALTAAVWDDGRIDVDGYPLGVDQAANDGDVYSDKAPGQPFLAVPAYAAYRTLGGEPADRLRVEGNLGLWTVSVWTAALPAAALAILIRRRCREVDPVTGTAAAAAVAVGTLLLPFGSLLFGHVLSTLLAFAAWMVLRPERLGPRQAALGGALLAGAVATEFTMGLAVVVIVGYLAVEARRRLPWVVLGAAPVAVLLGWYQWAAFGSPFRLSYASSTFAEQAEAVGLPDAPDASRLEHVVRVLVGERGLFVTSPVLVLAVVGAAILVRSGAGGARRRHIVEVLVAGAVIGVQLAWSNPTGGDSPGARYATAAAAFLAPGLAAAWRRWPRPAVVAAALSAVIMAAATWTEPLLGRDSTGSVGEWLRLLGQGDAGSTVFGMWIGSAAWVVVVAAIGAAAANLWRAHRAELAGLPPSP